MHKKAIDVTHRADKGDGPFTVHCSRERNTDYRNLVELRKHLELSGDGRSRNGAIEIGARVRSDPARDFLLIHQAKLKIRTYIKIAASTGGIFGACSDSLNFDH